MSEFGKLLVLLGGLLLVLGTALTVLGKLPGVGRLPGDLLVETERFRLYIPFTSCLLLSVLLSLALWLLRR